jgi:hypothetical protein
VNSKGFFSHLLTASRRSDSDTRNAFILNGFLQAGLFGLAVLTWWILKRWFFPEFNPFWYWNLTGAFWDNVWGIILPITVYGFFVGQLEWFAGRDGGKSPLYSQSITLKTFIACFAGVFEELQHRGVYIYFGLIMVALTNYCFSWLFPIALIVLALGLMKAFSTNGLGSFVIALVFVALWFWLRNVFHDNPILVLNEWWLHAYQWIVVSPARIGLIFGGLMALFLLIHVLMSDNEFPMPYLLLRFATFIGFSIWVLPLAVGVFTSPIITPVNADRWTALLYVGAMFWSNMKFRDGHKHQGPAGMLNANMFGYYMFFIAFTYGLAYAIAVHLTYDLVLFFSEHIVQVIKNRHAHVPQYRRSW